MSIISSIQSQYHAAFNMLENAIKDCPVSLWQDNSYQNKYWHIAFHTLFYSHLYLSESKEAFIFWKKYKENAHQLNVTVEPYSQQEILEYLELCRKQVDERIPLIDLDAPAGFSWLPMNRLELLLYNLRHIQHHTGQLIDRLRGKAKVSSNWMVMK
jgi:uncharacterized damage-inducible protein DinB